jgi:two-component system chemotaxis sensor kinase CheA
VQSGGERFAIPQVSLLELVRLDGEQVKAGIEEVYGAPIYRLRGQLLPLVYLNRELGLDGKGTSEVVNIVVLQADERVFGLAVDAVCDSEEIVVKPLSKLLKSLNVFAGATIMGDGQVALILDVLGLGQRAHVVGESKDRGTQVASGGTDKHMAVAERHVVLVFQSPDDGRMAIPIKRVARLEELDVKTIERTGDSEVVQYRGSILPLIRVFAVLPERRKELRNPEAGVTGDLLPVVVVTHGDRSFGLVVGRILDTVEIDVTPARAASRAGILGSQVINEKITEILDIEALLRTALPEIFTETVQAKG